MNISLLGGLVTIAAVVIVLVATGFKYVLKPRRSPTGTWEQLLDRIVPVAHDAIATVALDAVEPPGERRTDEHRRVLSRKEIWKLLGGMKGIRGMENNARVLSEMADHFEHLHPETADSIYEIRSEIQALAWHTRRLHQAEENDCLELHFHSYGQNAAISYYCLVKKARALFQPSAGPPDRWRPL